MEILSKCASDVMVTKIPENGQRVTTKIGRCSSCGAEDVLLIVKGRVLACGPCLKALIRRIDAQIEKELDTVDDETLRTYLPPS